jgi:hypothetical protein
MTPPGFITLYETVDTVGRALFGASWQHASPLGNCEAHRDSGDPYLRVIAMIAEGCEAGRIAAGYRTISGNVDSLNPAVWQSPVWQNYFIKGDIELELPLVDDRLQPVSDGRTARCPREIFVRRDSLDSFMAPLATTATESKSSKPRPRDKRDRAREASAALWPNGIPDRLVLSNDRLSAAVLDWLKADCKKRGLPADIPDHTTILRAVGRREK